MKKPFDREELIREIPQIEQIHNENWKEAVIKAWEMAYNDSEFDELTTVLFSPFYDAPTLVGHTRAVTENSIRIAENMEAEYHYGIDMDVIICVGVLHDISKLREHVPDGNGGVKKGPVGEAYQHAFFSAHYALEAGLPDKIVAAIFAHTGNTKTLPTSLEGIIVTYGDMADADMHRFTHGRPLQVAKIHKG